MRSRELLAIVALCSAAGGWAQPAPALSASAVQAAASAVQADPLLAGKSVVKTLQFKKRKDETKPQPKPDDALRWWSELIGNLSAGLRVAIWLVGAGLFVAALLRLRTWLIEREGPARLIEMAPNHVGSLDIRPASLPEDVGSAARELWLRGELRPALSLLYRGALSRLVHGHGVPIRSATTEMECLQLALPRLGPSSRDYLLQLIRCWQAVAYAQHEVAASDLERLCLDFEPCLPSGRRPA